MLDIRHTQYRVQIGYVLRFVWSIIEHELDFGHLWGVESLPLCCVVSVLVVFLKGVSILVGINF